MYVEGFHTLAQFWMKAEDRTVGVHNGTLEERTGGLRQKCAKYEGLSMKLK